MGVILQSTVYDKDGTEYTVSIDQDGFGGSSTDMTLRGFSITWQPDGEELHTPILSSSCNIAVLVRDSTVQSLLVSLASGDEEEFTVKIEKEGAIYWAGLILMDLASVQYHNYPYTFSLTAVDGIARLKDIDYNNAGTAYTGSETFLEHIFNVLGKIPTDHHWGTSDVYLRCEHQWWDTSQSSAAASYNGLEYSRFDHRAVRKVEDNGEYTYRSAYDVLREICVNSGSRFMLSDGAFICIEVNRYRHTSVVTIKNYVKAGTSTTSTILSNWVGWNHLLGNSQDRMSSFADVTALNGGTESYLAPLQAVQVRYNHFSTQNLFPGAYWNNGTTTAVENGPVDDNSNTARILLQFAMTYAISFSNSFYSQNGYLLFNATIKITESGGTQHWLSRSASVVNNTVVYGDPEWVTSAANVQFYSDLVGISGYQYYTEEQFITPDLPASGDLTLQFGYVQYDASQGTVANSGNTAHTVTWRVDMNNVEMLYSGDLDDRVDFRLATATNGTTGNSRILRLETYLGDGPTLSTPGAIEVQNPGGSGWTQSTEWDVLGRSNYYDRAQLLALEILALQQTAVYKLEIPALSDGGYEAHHLLQAYGRRMIFMGGTFDVTNIQWRGLWGQISYTITGASTPTPTDSRGNPILVQPLRFPAARASIDDGLRFIPNNSPGIEGLARSMALDRNIYTTEEAFDSGDTIADLDVQIRALSYVLYDGDLITIWNNATGESQELELDGNYGGGNIPIDDIAATANFPYGSFVTLSQTGMIQLLTELRTKYVHFMLYDSSETISGTATFNEFFVVPAGWSGYQFHSYEIRHYTAGTQDNGNDDYHFRVTHDDGSTTTNVDVEVEFDEAAVTKNVTLGSPPYLYIVLTAGDIFTFEITNWNNVSGTSVPPDGLQVSLKIIATI